MKVKRLIALTASMSLLLVGSASAHETRATIETGTTNPVPVLNQGERAKFRVIDNGRSILILGDARGMTENEVYVSLIYPEPNCAGVVGDLTLNGAWQAHGQDRQRLMARYTGETYEQVKGKIDSLSIRAVTSVVEAVPGQTNPVLTSTLEARACANLS